MVLRGSAGAALALGLATQASAAVAINWRREGLAKSNDECIKTEHLLSIENNCEKYIINYDYNQLRYSIRTRSNL
jgi:hypothetical protein